MARNPNVAKIRKQAFRRRRGVFAQHAVQSSLDTDVNPSLREFWSQRTSPRSMGVSRVGAGIPGESQELFNYRQRGNTSGEHTWLDTLFPGVHMQSAERRAAEERKLKITMEGAEPTSCLILDRTKSTQLFLYYTVKKDAWWFVFRHTLTSCSIVKTSIRYSSKDRALATRQTDTIRWQKAQPIPSS